MTCYRTNNLLLLSLMGLSLQVFCRYLLINESAGQGDVTLRIIKVITNPPERTVNVCAKCSGSRYNSCRLIWSKMLPATPSVGMALSLFTICGSTF